jgi:hypothetical protein
MLHINFQKKRRTQNANQKKWQDSQFCSILSGAKETNEIVKDFGYSFFSLLSLNPKEGKGIFV